MYSFASQIATRERDRVFLLFVIVEINIVIAN